VAAPELDTGPRSGPAAPWSTAGRSPVTRVGARLPRFLRGRPPWAWLLVLVSVLCEFWPVPPWSLLRADMAVWTTFFLSIAVMVVAGWLLLATPAQRGNGGLMIVLAANAAVASSFASTEGGPGQVLGYLLYQLSGVPFALLVLRWPRPRLRDTVARRTVGYAAVTLPVVRLLDVVTWDPAWGGYTGSAWWPTLVHHERLNLWVYRIEQVNIAALATFLLLLAVLRLCRAPQVERRTLVPVVLAAAFFGVGAVADAVSVLVDTTSPVSVVLSNLSFLALPLSVLVSLALRRIQRALAVEALLQPQRLPDPESVRTALAAALGDRGLTLALWSPERDRFLAPDGHEVSGTSTTRTQVDLFSSTGGPVARLGIDPRLADETDLVESVSRAAGLALDNARLQVELRARQREVDESSTRLHEAQDMERSLVRLVPGGLAERLRADPTAVTRTERLTVTVLMSDVRGYSGIAERSLPADLAEQLNEHRRAMNEVVLGEGGTVMQYVGDAVLAVFGAPEPLTDHAGRALRAALGMQHAQLRLDADWTTRGLEPFGLGIGLCTGEVAAAFLGSAERLEYTVVGDTVNLAARLCDLARPAGRTVASAATVAGATGAWSVAPLPALQVKGRVATVSAYRVFPAE
jgi:class 3 adenylate cyclase